METLALGIYLLVWPVIGLVVLVVLWGAVIAEFRAKRREGDEDIV